MKRFHKAPRVKLEKLVGQTFNLLTLLSVTDKSTADCKVIGLFSCACGGQSEISISRVKGGNIKSCGCQKTAALQDNTKYIAGKRFGLITVIKDSGKRNQKGRIFWECVCDCGNKCLKVSSYLINGDTKSCGCLKKKQQDAIGKNSITHGLSKTIGYKRHYWALRRTRKQQAFPKWANRKAITKIYANKPEGCHVDHIIPLAHDLVCGLHVQCNLAYLPAKENISKKNKFEPIFSAHKLFKWLGSDARG